MRNTYNIRFECKKAKAQIDGKAPVYGVITVNGSYILVQLPIKCRPEDFKKLLNSRTTNQVRQITGKFSADIDQIRTNLIMNDELVTAKRLKDIYLNGYTKTICSMRDLMNEFRKQKAEEGISTGTWKKYENALNDFLNETGHTMTDDITEFNKKDVLLYEAKARKKYAETTACKSMKLVKAVFAFGVASDKLTHSPFGNMKIGHGDNERETEYLTYEEIVKIRNLNLNSEKLDNVRTLFLWECFTGQNYSDMRILEEGDVQKDEYGRYYIKKARYKKGKFGKEHIYTAYLYEDAITIYNRYSISGFKRLLISNTNYNIYLKELIKLTDIDKNISSKCGRKTYACYLYNTLNITDLTILQVMLGHENIKQTLEYVKVFDETIAKKVQDNTPSELDQIKRTSQRIN